MSLRLRLSLLILGLFLLGMLAVMTRSIDNARREIRSEIESGNLLTRHFLGLWREQDYILQSGQLKVFQELLGALGAARPVDIEIVSASSDVALSSSGASPAVQAPPWFVNLLGINAALLEENHSNFTVDAGSQNSGFTVITRSNPADEINEIWQQVKVTLISGVLGLLLLCVASNLALLYWLRPLARIASIIDEIGHGAYSPRVPRLSLPELDRVGARINRLLGLLGTSKSDNDRLTHQALASQEQQRRYFAQELHDTLGQSVSAIKAVAVSIAVRTRESAPEIADSAVKIEKISDAAYGSVHDLMTWLHPAILDELGLQQAIMHMVDEWNRHHDTTFCRLLFETSCDDLTDQQAINLYRIVQEALTNTARHAQAQAVSVILSGQETISLNISDNGKGFDPGTTRMGMGLAGIRDRVNMLQGSFAILAAPGNGTTLQIELPRNPGYRRIIDDTRCS